MILSTSMVCTEIILLFVQPEELAGFEEAWNSNVDGRFSRSKDACETHGNAGSFQPVSSFLML